MENSQQINLIPRSNPITIVRQRSFCCEQKCFRKPKDEVDGMACKKCKSYCYCQCLCITFQNMLKKNF